MIIAFIFVVLAVAAVLLLFRAVRGRGAEARALEDLEGRTQPVDLEAFRNLVDPAEEAYLRQHLPGPEFRAVQRERLRATLEYVERTAHNAALLIRLGEAARASAEPEVARAGQELVNSALRMRLYAQMARVQLYARIVMPQARISVAGLVESYQSLRDHVAHLSRLQRPAYATRIVSVL